MTYTFFENVSADRILLDTMRIQVQEIMDKHRLEELEVDFRAERILDMGYALGVRLATTVVSESHEPIVFKQPDGPWQAWKLKYVKQDHFIWRHFPIRWAVTTYPVVRLYPRLNAKLEREWTVMKVLNPDGTFRK